MPLGLAPRSWRRDAPNAWIAQRLFLTEKAVVQHTSRIYDAMALPATPDDHRRVMAVVRYLEGSLG